MKTGIAFASTLAALLAFATPPSSSGWREANVARIQEAVLLDLLQDNRWGFSGHANPVPGAPVVCVRLWRTADLFVASAEYDPSAATLARLQRSGRRVVAGSACTLSPDRTMLLHAGEEAVLIGAGTPNWIDSGFVKIQGTWYLGPLYAAGSRYTVSYSDGDWHVDTVAFTWVARDDASGRRTSGWS
jgi:hypothetical protein